MRRNLLVLFSTFLLVAAALRAQTTREQFRGDFNKGFEIPDAKTMDLAMKKPGAAGHAALYFEELYVQKLAGKQDVLPKLDALKASWERCFDKSPTLDKLARWMEGMQTSTYETLQKGRNASAKLWQAHQEMKNATHDERQKLMRDIVSVAQSASQIGHNLEVAEIYSLAVVVGSVMPDKTLDDRKEVLGYLDLFLEARRGWEFTFDTLYIQNFEWQKAEKVRIAEAEKQGDKRKSEGYDPNSKGIDSLVMPGAKAELHAFTYEAQTTWETELDYGPKNGALPVLWWNISVSKEGEAKKFDWFRRRDLFFVRLGANKFGVALDAAEAKKAVEVDVSGKAKPSTFWLDSDKKFPYTMFFWAGSDKEKVGEVESNLQFTTDFANVYFRSAASWKTAIGADSLVFYDDNCNGNPCDGEVYEPALRVATAGDHAGEGTTVPLLDSMRIGKGPRVPFSEFVKLATGWVHMRREKESIGVRPLNPEYFKTGKLKLTWNGPKPTAPVQLVVQGAGDYKTAFFDVAGGKEVEVPAGNYTVVFGRILVGKGARAQQATLYQGTSGTFVVEAGKTFDLKMGAPFAIQFERKGDEEATVDALKVLLHDVSGCVLTDLYGIGLAPEVLASKSDDGKGARPVGKFVHFNDGELARVAAEKHNKLGVLIGCWPMPEGYKNGELVLKVKMPGPGWKMGMSMKKHPLFGPLGSPWL